MGQRAKGPRDRRTIMHDRAAGLERLKAQDGPMRPGHFKWDLFRVEVYFIFLQIG
jgi:hypothetical protein